jgi:hypothetical protein
VGQTKSVIDPTDTRTDSQKAYDYLMGKPGAENPMLFYHDKGPLVPLDLNTRTGGHYALNAAGTGYDWIADAAPAAAPATDAGLPALVVGPQGGGGSDRVKNNEVTAAGLTNGDKLSNAGLIALGKFANAFNLGDTANYNPTVVDTPGTTQSFSDALARDNESRNAPAPSEGRDSGPSEGAQAAARADVGQSGLASGGLTAFASGGLGSLGGYSDGGQLLKGPGDGVSDSIPATIGHGQPARLADGEFVVPARIVSELGNGSTEAGAKQLYAMMARIQAGRAKTTGKNQVATNSKADRHLPA